QRERKAAVLAGRIRQREARAVGPSVAVFGAEYRQKQNVRPLAADDARRVVGIAGHLDAHRTFVDDDDEDDLRRVGNGGETLAHVDRLEPFRRPQPRGHVVDGVRLERHADAHIGETAYLVVARRRVALNLDRGDRLAARWLTLM